MELMTASAYCETICYFFFSAVAVAVLIAADGL